ncbi:MAG: glutaredoxin domain-containing protein, partial [Pseudohongiellaceae bacterium]
AEAGYAFEEIAADGNPALRAELLKRSGQSTLPQIFVGDESVGGYRELTLTLSNGRFAQMLERD